MPTKKKAPPKPKSKAKAAPKPVPAPNNKGGLNEQQERFCLEYLIDLNGTQAYKRAGYKVKDDAVAAAAAARLLGNVKVAEKIASLQAERGARTTADADMVVEQWRAIALADPNEIMEFRRVCCRFCHGKGHKYQRTPAERERAMAEWLAKKAAAENDARAKPVPDFDELGGTGYDTRKAPHQDCPECHGAGEGMAHFHDTRKLSAAARFLYGGVKVTKEGIEVKINSKEKALEMLARHNGMLVDRSKVDLNVSLAQALDSV